MTLVYTTIVAVTSHSLVHAHWTPDTVHRALLKVHSVPAYIRHNMSYKTLIEIRNCSTVYCSNMSKIKGETPSRSLYISLRLT